MTTLFTACNRPVAYFQKSPREHFAVTTPTPAPVVTTESAPVALAATTVTPETASGPVAQATQVNEALNQMDALVRNDSKLAADKTVQKRLNRIRSLVASTSAKSTLAPSATTAPKKASLMERLVLKQMNKKISKQLAPNNPNKTMANTGILATGAVLVIIGLLLLLLTTGTGATVGVIVLLAGAVILLVGLL
ncbi:hypothetical protein GJR95_32945 [Spirosoma endbachense]|uniref:Uncharacterized protein n=2 Tax=Spirosoma endbachense TaxID=2666025 RepID=A0A6P1W921_9BACT|nr:hypothetical protein GJR95_32945 [Spirosoma endbachense]